MGLLKKAKRRVLEGIARLAVRHPVSILVAAGLLTLAALSVARDIQIRTDLVDFLPESSPVVQSFRRAVENFGTSDNLLIVLQGSGQEDVEPREYLADIIAEKILATGLVQFVDYRMDLDTLHEYRDSLLPYALNYLEESDLPAFEEKLSDPGIRAQIRENRRLLLSPMSPVGKDLVRLDPLGLRTLFRSNLVDRPGKLRLSFQDGYLFSEDLEHLLMIAKPIRPAQDIQFTRSLVRTMNEIADESLEELRAEGEDLDSIRVGFTGGYPIATDYEAILRRDILTTILTASIGVVILFSLAFRSVGSILYVGVPLVVGLSWTGAFAALTVGSINLFTGASVTVLMGLEVDFAIHLLNRYREERGKGRNPEESLVETLGDTGAGILTAASTSIAAFLSTLAAEFRGLVQLGMICSAGMILCLLANFLLIPAMLVIVSRWEGVRGVRREPRGFGLEPVVRFVIHRPVPVIVAGIGLFLFLGTQALYLRLEPGLRHLRPAHSSAMQLQKEVGEKIGSPFVYVMVLGQAPTEREVLRLADRTADRMEEMVNAGTLISFNSLRTILPPFELQQRNIDWLQARKKEHPESFDADRILATLRSSLEEEGFREDEEMLAETEAFLRSALDVRKPIGIDDLKRTPLEPRVSRFARRASTGYEVVTYAYPDPALESRDINREMNRVLEELGPGNEVIGVSILGEEIKRLLRQDGVLVTAIALTAVLLLVYLDFRRWKYVLLAAVPVITGVTWTLGCMKVFGISFNMVNVGILPILLGIGVDDGIHIVHRFTAGRGDVVRIFQKTGRAVLITTLTTIVGFGTLIFADYPGLVSAGLVAIIGMVSCFVSSVTLLPALLWKMGKD